MTAPLDVHVYTEDGNGRCTGCGLGRGQGRGADAHLLPDLPDAQAVAERIVGEGRPVTPDETPAPPNTRTPVRIGLDWRKDGARVGAPAACTDCGCPALTRDPVDGKPRHKVCAEAAVAKRVTANSGGAR